MVTSRVSALTRCVRGLNRSLLRFTELEKYAYELLVKRGVGTRAVYFAF